MTEYQITKDVVNNRIYDTIMGHVMKTLFIYILIITATFLISACSGDRIEELEAERDELMVRTEQMKDLVEKRNSQLSDDIRCIDNLETLSNRIDCSHQMPDHFDFITRKIDSLGSEYKLDLYVFDYSPSELHIVGETHDGGSEVIKFVKMLESRSEFIDVNIESIGTIGQSGPRYYQTNIQTGSVYVTEAERSKDVVEVVLPNSTEYSDSNHESLNSVNHMAIAGGTPIAGFIPQRIGDEGFKVRFANMSVADSTLNTADYIDEIIGWVWEFGDGSIASGSPSPVHTYVSEGSYTVTLKVIKSDGDSNTISKTITANPAKYYQYFVDTSYKNRLQVEFAAPATSAENTGFLWDFGDGVTVASTRDRTNHVYERYGNYHITLTIIEEMESTSGTSDSIISYISSDYWIKDPFPVRFIILITVDTDVLLSRF